MHDKWGLGMEALLFVLWCARGRWLLVILQRIGSFEQQFEWDYYIILEIPAKFFRILQKLINISFEWKQDTNGNGPGLDWIRLDSIRMFIEFRLDNWESIIWRYSFDECHPKYYSILSFRMQDSNKWIISYVCQCIVHRLFSSSNGTLFACVRNLFEQMQKFIINFCDKNFISKYEWIHCVWWWLWHCILGEWMTTAAIDAIDAFDRYAIRFGFPDFWHNFSLRESQYFFFVCCFLFVSALLDSVSLALCANFNQWIYFNKTIKFNLFKF